MASDFDIKFCENCGTPLEEGSAFCMECGSPVAGESVQAWAEKAPALAIDATGGEDALVKEEARGENSSDSNVPSARRGIRLAHLDKRMLISAAAVVVAIIGVVSFAVFSTQGNAEYDNGFRGSIEERDREMDVGAASGSSGEESYEVPGDQGRREKNPVAGGDPRFDTSNVHYDQVAYTEQISDSDPVFAIAYPSSWSVASYMGAAKTVTDCAIPLIDEPDHSYRGGLSIQVDREVDKLSHSEEGFFVESVIKLGDSQFMPTEVGGGDFSTLAPCMVAEIVIMHADARGEAFPTRYIAVVPESYLDKEAVLIDRTGKPGFNYPSFTYAVSEISDRDLTEAELEEIVDILSTFRVATSEEIAQASAATQAASEYVIAESDTRYLDRTELEAMELRDLFIARNEIYARHGRGFKNEELRNHFGATSWYVEQYSPEEFDARPDPLNEIEKANASLIGEVERERNSPYL